jgi:hypothetical protein
MGYDKLLIAGFDGLDYKKMQEYGCQNFRQQSFGKLDLEGQELKTPELWASMITGTTPDEHGIDRMLTFKGEKVRKVDNYILRFFELFGKNALHLRECLHYYLFDSGLMVPDKNFLEVDSIFETYRDTEALTIPGYTEYPYLAGNIGVGKTWRERSPVSIERVHRDIRAEHEYRKQQLFENIGRHAILMQHFHYPDWYQHIYPDGSRDKDLYEEMNDLAGEILEKADNDTLVLFCSDHGLEDGGHRDQAFYSANCELPDDVRLTTLIGHCLEHVDLEKAERATDSIDI